MKIEIKYYTKDFIDDVIQFENDLRKEENFWGWDINGKYIKDKKERGKALRLSRRMPDKRRVASYTAESW